ncbi:MAG: hypothetical protein ACLRSW_02905 [Christensenellaceae bacterium]
MTAYLEYENGATGVFVTTTGETPGTNRFEVSGTGGKLLCEGGALKWYKNASDSAAFSLETKEFFGRPKCECVAVETDGKNPQHAGIINNFANALLGKEDFCGRQGRAERRGADERHELSGWQGGHEVTLPVDEELYLAELNKRRAASRLKTADDCAVADTLGSYGSKEK